MWREKIFCPQQGTVTAALEERHTPHIASPKRSQIAEKSQRPCRQISGMAGRRLLHFWPSCMAAEDQRAERARRCCKGRCQGFDTVLE